MSASCAELVESIRERRLASGRNDRCADNECGSAHADPRKLRDATRGEDVIPLVLRSDLLVGSDDLAFHVSVLEGFVFEGDTVMLRLKTNRDMDAKFAAQADGEPGSIVLPAVVDREADAGEVSAQERADAEGQTTRQLGEDVNRLEFLCVDVGLAGPIDVIVVFRSEGE